MSKSKIENFEKTYNTLSQLNALLELDLINNLSFDINAEDIEDTEDINTLLAVTYLQKHAAACKSRDDKKSNLFSSKAYNIYHYHIIDKPKNKQAFNDAFKASQFASADFKAYKFIYLKTDKQYPKVTMLSHIHDNMSAAGYCQGKVDIFYHSDLSIIGLTPQVVDKILIEELSEKILQTVLSISKLKNHFKAEEMDSQLSKYTNNIKEDSKVYPFSWSYICGYMLKHHDSDTMRLIMK